MCGGRTQEADIRLRVAKRRQLLETQSQDDVGGRYMGQKYMRQMGGRTLHGSTVHIVGESVDAVVGSAMGTHVELDEVVSAEDSSTTDKSTDKSTDKTTDKSTDHTDGSTDEHAPGELIVPFGARIFVAWYGNSARPWDTSRYGEMRDVSVDGQLVHGQDVTDRVKAMVKDSPSGTGPIPADRAALGLPTDFLAHVRSRSLMVC